jgi:hypothetical protein
MTRQFITSIRLSLPRLRARSALTSCSLCSREELARSCSAEGGHRRGDDSSPSRSFRDSATLFPFMNGLQPKLRLHGHETGQKRTLCSLLSSSGELAELVCWRSSVPLEQSAMPLSLAPRLHCSAPMPRADGVVESEASEL